MKQLKISRPVMERLPVYLHYLKSLSEKPEYISSTVIARALRLGEVQVRKDLGIVSGAGKPKVGYGTTELIRSLEEFLGYNSTLHAVIVGAGNLGRALIRNSMFEKRGVDILGMFDSDHAMAGTTVAGVTIYDLATLEDFCQRVPVDIAVLTLPKEDVPAVAERLVKCGVKGLWNYMGVELDYSRDDIIIENVHLGDSLMILNYEICRKMQEDEEKRVAQAKPDLRGE